MAKFHSQRPLILAAGCPVNAHLRAFSSVSTSVEGAALESGKPLDNSNGSCVKLQGLPIGETVALICDSAEEGHMFDALGFLEPGLLLE